MDYTKQEYLSYVQKKSPNSKIWKNTLIAFLVGGAICTVGQGLGEIYKSFFGLNEESVKTLANQMS